MVLKIMLLRVRVPPGVPSLLKPVNQVPPHGRRGSACQIASGKSGRNYPEIVDRLAYLSR